MFIPDPTKKTVKIPVKIVDGQVVFLYGDKLPEMKNVTGDLVVPASSFLDQKQIDSFSKKNWSTMLPKGSVLIINVASDRNEPGLLTAVRNIDRNFPRTAKAGFVRVILNQPLYLRHRGTKSSVLQACLCRLPDLGIEATSLNHAYTIASKRFETERRTNTGNVFLNVYHNLDGRWEKLQWLRERLDAKFERSTYKMERRHFGEHQPTLFGDAEPEMAAARVTQRRPQRAVPPDEVISDEVAPEVFDELFANGWYHFNQKFRRYIDRVRYRSLPLRIRLENFKPSKSQRRVLRINADLSVKRLPLFVEKDSEECVLFRRHNTRFSDKAPKLIQLPRQGERNRKFHVFDGEKLIAASYFETGAYASHAYYATFDPDIQWRSLGTLTILKEIEYAKENGNEFYYLGYAFDKPSFYDYKKRFIGLESYDWNTMEWKKFERLR
jgi:arginine-tRNA-protein transferase